MGRYGIPFVAFLFGDRNEGGWVSVAFLGYVKVSHAEGFAAAFHQWFDVEPLLVFDPEMGTYNVYIQVDADLELVGEMAGFVTGWSAARR